MDQKKADPSAGMSVAANDTPQNKSPEPKPPAEPEKKVEPPSAPTDGKEVQAGDVVPPLEAPLSEHPEKEPRGKYLAYLSLGALGIVYGDIGTSPLYSLRECFHSKHGVAPLPENVLGVLSLVTWSLIIVISLKYLAFVMRADNKGEGGILALMSLVRPEKTKVTQRWILTGIGLFGAALLYGDGIITPAISVLSAVEGLHVATPLFEGKVVQITIVVLVLLFYFQKKGTSGVGAVFGPVMLVWFTCLFLLGIYQIVQFPSVLKGINPYYAFEFFLHNKWHGFLVLGSVFLVVTGGEALYADMGHFGKKPIRLAWFFLVLPALQINYLGQGALLLRNPSAAEHPFYLMAPGWALFPLVGLATVATSIASQAVISGAFSLTRQAVQLGYWPRMHIRHTSAREIGQIYIPAINWGLMVATIWLVAEFKTSSNLAAAYGVAVTTTMVATTVLLYFVCRSVWKWPFAKTLILASFFLVIDLAFFGANIIKFFSGGWFPLAVGAGVFTLMTTWRRGRMILNERLSEVALPDHLFIDSLKAEKPLRVSGTAVFLDRTPDATPHALLHNIKHNKILHEQVILLTIITEESPHVPEDKRIKIVPRGECIFRMVIKFGFMEDPDVTEVLKKVELNGKKLKPEAMSFFLGREKLIATSRPGMSIWREKLFAWMSQNATGAAYFFNLPPDRIVELGASIEL
jgi:KUP system potassium uptake protein